MQSESKVDVLGDIFIQNESDRWHVKWAEKWKCSCLPALLEAACNTKQSESHVQVMFHVVTLRVCVSSLQAPPPLPDSPPPFSPSDDSPAKEAPESQTAFTGEGPLSPMDTDSLEMLTPGDTSSAATTPDLDPQQLFIKLKEVSSMMCRFIS